MSVWLVKSEPDDYSAHDLERDRETLWTGVRNAVAQKHVAAMLKGDEVFVYHSGKQKAVVAMASVFAPPQPDPTDESGKAFAAPLRFERMLATPVSLATLKADPRFAQFDLVRISRLSVMPVPVALGKIISTLAAAPHRGK